MLSENAVSEQPDVLKRKGYVAFLDVLGFRSMVGTPDAEHKLSAYMKTVDDAVAGSGEDLLEYVIFSDSIVINSKVDDEKAFESIVAASSALFARFLEEGMALRGSIAYGDFVRSERSNGVFVAGRPIVEAYDYELRQNWVGIIICPSAVSKQADLDKRCAIPQWNEINQPDFDIQRLRLPSLVNHLYSIPFHKQNESSLDEPDQFEGYAVLPTGGVSTNKVKKQLEEVCRLLERLKLIAPDPKAQYKFQKTIAWLRNVHMEWQQIEQALNARAAALQS